jgi:hypothetical protein
VRHVGHVIRYAYTERKQHYHTGSVKNLQSRGIHDNFTNIFGNYIHTNIHAAAQVDPNKETPNSDVWVNGRRSPSKILKF